MADGYQVLTADGGTTTGHRSGRRPPAGWRTSTDFAGRAATATGCCTGRPTSPRSCTTTSSSVAKSAAAGRSTGRGHPGPAAAGAARPPGRPTRTPWPWPANSDPEAILLSDAPPGAPARCWPAVGGDAPSSALELRRSRRRPGPDPRDTAGPSPAADAGRDLDRGQQRLDRDGPPAGSRLITSAAQARPRAPTSRSPPWLRPRTLADLLRATPAAWDQKYRVSRHRPSGRARRRAS